MTGGTLRRDAAGGGYQAWPEPQRGQEIDVVTPALKAWPQEHA